MHLIEFSKLLHRISHPHDALALPLRNRPKIARFKCLHEYSDSQFTQTSAANPKSESMDQAPPGLSSPRGYLPVYVGDDNMKYMIKAKHLNNPLVADLLERSAEEHGYSQSGALKIWCDAEVFESVLATAAASHKRSRGRFSSRIPRGKYVSFRYEFP